MSPWRSISLWVALGLAAFVLLLVVATLGLKAQARVFPLGVGIATLFLLALIVAGEFSPRLQKLFEVSWEGAVVEEGMEPEQGAPDLSAIPWRVVGLVFGSLVLFAAGVLLVGFTITTPVYVFLFSRLYGGAGWIGSGLLAGGTTASMIGLSQLLRADLYPGLLAGAAVPPF